MTETKSIEFAEAVIHFFATENDGRKKVLNIESLKYMPHFRVNETSEHLEVRFVGGPREIKPGDTVKVQVLLLYPQVNYDELTIGCEFQICEGALPIGRGRITRRWLEQVEHEVVFRLLG